MDEGNLAASYLVLLFAGVPFLVPVLLSRLRCLSVGRWLLMLVFVLLAEAAGGYVVLTTVDRAVANGTVLHDDTKRVGVLLMFSAIGLPAGCLFAAAVHPKPRGR